jgi:hypothetical protein
MHFAVVSLMCGLSTDSEKLKLQSIIMYVACALIGACAILAIVNGSVVSTVLSSTVCYVELF